MIRICNWRDMAQFGIEALTGEACAYSMRLLCDVNEQGRRLLLDYLGLPDATELAIPYNSKVGGEPTVGSIMVERRLEGLAVFALRRAGMKAVVVKRHDADGCNMEEVVGFDDAEVDSALYYLASLTPRSSDLYVRRDADPAVTRGDRNVHQMSGRIK